MTDPFKLYGGSGLAVSPIGQVPQAIGYPLAKVDSQPAGGFDPTTGMVISRILDGVSSTAPQNPAGLGAVNAVQVNFGGAVNTVSDPVMLNSSGVVTINETGTYRIKVALQFGRSGATGTSVLLFRVRVNGVQAGRSIVTKLGNSNDTQYFENDTWITFPAGTLLAFDVMRDPTGSDFGGLFGFTTATGWGDAPSAAIRIERWITTP